MYAGVCGVCEREDSSRSSSSSSNDSGTGSSRDVTAAALVEVAVLVVGGLAQAA